LLFGCLCHLGSLLPARSQAVPGHILEHGSLFLPGTAEAPAGQRRGQRRGQWQVSLETLAEQRRLTAVGPEDLEFGSKKF
jgi:hypothetical protein